MAENLQIRLADPKEADRLAEIEAICFPPAEAASHEDVVNRMGAFPEDLSTEEPQINRYFRTNFIMISLFTKKTERSRPYSD